MNRAGFTIIELLVVASVIALLSAIGFVSYGQWQRTAAKNSVQTDLLNAASGMESYRNFAATYTRNVAGTGFVSSQGVAIRPYTNIATTYQVVPYQNLQPNQNVELFMYSCNNALASSNRACDLIGNGGGAKIHVPGTQSSNTIWPGQICEAAGAGCGTVLPNDCGGVPTAACSQVVSSFKQQGGTFPIVLSSGRANLPPQQQTEIVDPSSRITKYCLEGVPANFSDIVIHVNSGSNTILDGPCNDPELRYLP